MKINYRVIEHSRQRYPTAGDYWWKGEILEIRVSRLKDPIKQYLIMVHEFVEATAVRIAGKPDQSTEFDIAYEQARAVGGRAPCGCRADAEPGDDPHAPYYNEHQLATKIERIVAKHFRIGWYEYGEEVDALDEALANNQNGGLVDKPRTQWGASNTSSTAKGRPRSSRQLPQP